jgi:carbon starvation protein
MEDGLDDVPTNKYFLMGQHFSAIAAAGPITGPIIAFIAYGWGPTLMWIILGTIFIGGVHDLGALIASVRNKVPSITETVRTNVSHRAWILFNLFIWVPLDTGEVVGGPASQLHRCFTCSAYHHGPAAQVYKAQTYLGNNYIFLPLVAVAIWVGKYIPFNLQAILGLATPAVVPV